MIAIYGRELDRIDLGYFETRYCEKCGVKTPFHWILHYAFVHLFFLLGAVTAKQFRLTCQNCGTAASDIPNEDIVRRAQIPFLRKFGLALWALVVLAILIPIVMEEYKAVF